MAKMTLCTKNPSGNNKIAEPGSKRVYGVYRSTSKIKETGEIVHKTCPSSCSLLAICYANSGMANIQQANAETRNDNVTDWIKQLPQNHIVRHLVTGDVYLNDKVDLEYIKETVDGHTARMDGKGYGYTHGWDKLEPEQLNTPNLTFNASCDNEKEVRTALAAGWDVVKIWDENDGNVKHTPHYKQVKCPNQTVGVTCEKCQLCMRSNRLDKDGKPIVVAFKAHGSMQKRVNSAIAAAFNDGETE